LLLSLLLCGALLLLATLTFSQQQAKPPPGSPPYISPPTFPEEPQMPHDQKAPPPQALSSTQVEQQIQHFNAEPALANTNLGIKADESLVVLSGTVDSDTQHELALRIAQSYAGDRKIVDKITVRQQT
jgi:glucose/arabinose dehydrogenase